MLSQLLFNRCESTGTSRETRSSLLMTACRKEQSNHGSIRLCEIPPDLRTECRALTLHSSCEGNLFNTQGRFGQEQMQLAEKLARQADAAEALSSRHVIWVSAWFSGLMVSVELPDLPKKFQPKTSFRC